MAERVGFEPTVRCRTHAFQACSFGHSDTSPRDTCNFFCGGTTGEKEGSQPVNLIPPKREEGLYPMTAKKSPTFCTTTEKAVVQGMAERVGFEPTVP